jgi:hypothetical protein
MARRLRGDEPVTIRRPHVARGRNIGERSLRDLIAQDRGRPLCERRRTTLRHHHGGPGVQFSSQVGRQHDEEKELLLRADDANAVTLRDDVPRRPAGSRMSVPPRGTTRLEAARDTRQWAGPRRVSDGESAADPAAGEALYGRHRPDPTSRPPDAGSPPSRRHRGGAWSAQAPGRARPTGSAQQWLGAGRAPDGQRTSGPMPLSSSLCRRRDRARARVGPILPTGIAHFAATSP